jgi:hypothetical protein
MAIPSAGGETHGAPPGECTRFSLILGSYWCKRPLWVISEAVELACGHLPGEEWNSSGVDALRRLFMVERHKLVTQAIDAGQLPCIKSREGESVKPRDFVEWAERFGHDIPQVMRDCFLLDFKSQSNVGAATQKRAAQKNCYEYLTEQMKNSPKKRMIDGESKSKDEIWKLCSKRFGDELSERGFNTEWKNALEMTGSNWNKAGRPESSH